MSTNDDNEFPRPRIDSFFTADRAESLNGKLYVMGGGFDQLWAPEFPHTLTFWMGAILRVPWADTNRRFPIVGSATTVDGEDLGFRMEGQFEAGRPAGARVGDVMATLAGPVQIEVEEELDFNLTLRFAEDERSLPLRVRQIVFPGGPSPASG
jgi:hypothetical protein